MTDRFYYVPQGGLPPQSNRVAGAALFTNAYLLIPKTVLSDITASLLPFWEGTNLWVLARPMSGFAETFSHYLMQLAPKGGSDRPDDDKTAEHVLFMVEGNLTLEYEYEYEYEQARPTQAYLSAGSYVYLPAGCVWRIRNEGQETACFHWIRKQYQAVEGIDKPPPLISSDADVKPVAMPDTNGLWATTRFVDPHDLRHDMHVNIVTFQPGGIIPFAETHVMEHGLYVLQGKGVYYLNGDWCEVEAGDYMWLRAFCPQACYAAGEEPFRYLLYKDVNRHAPLTGMLGRR